MEKSVRISIPASIGYETFVIHDMAALLIKIKQDPNISIKYKKMKNRLFKEWILSNKITKKQFEKLRKLNNLLIEIP